MSYGNITGVVNARDEMIDNKWTFLHAKSGSGTTLCYGLQRAPNSLNIITDSGDIDAVSCLDLIYDTLLATSPFDKTLGHETMPWMATDWEVQEWQPSYNSTQIFTKLVFHLRDGVKWHDGVELNSSDVKFTIDYLKNLGDNASLNYLVSDVHHVTTPDRLTVCVYENIPSIWTLKWIGMLPILPKHIYQNITDVGGFTPGSGQGITAAQALTGSGPWKYVQNNATMLCLEANRDYFMSTPPEEEIDFQYDSRRGSQVVDTLEAAMVFDAFATSGKTVPDKKWEPECDMNGDGIVNMIDIVTVVQAMNSTWGQSTERISQFPTNTSITIEHSDSIVLGSNLTVNVKLHNICRLQSFQLKLSFDNTKLQCLVSNVNNVFGIHTDILRNAINQTRGYVWIAACSGDKSSVTNQSLNVVTLTFNTTQPGSSLLNLTDTKLSGEGPPGMTCQLIDHNIVNSTVVAGVQTPTGYNKTVSPSGNLEITFSRVTSTGITSANTTQRPSNEFVSSLYLDVKTTAGYAGNVTVKFNYDPTGLSLEDEQAMKIWLWNETGKKWIDITTFVNTSSNVVYGLSPHLSMFGITSDMRIEGDFAGSGETTVSIPQSPPLPPPGLRLLSCYNIQTQKSYTPPVILRIAYDASIVPQQEEVFIKLWHWNGNSWDDTTTWVDTANDVVYGETLSLSMFGITCLRSTPQDACVVSSSLSKTAVGQGLFANINFTVKNCGDFARNFADITLYCNSTPLATYSANLWPGSETILKFTWITTSFLLGNYTISVCDRQIGWIIVSIIGDITGSPQGYPDGKVDIKDVSNVARLFGVNYPDPRYKPNFDIIYDLKIDIKDVSNVAKRFGQHVP
jgi:hypothetical protein